jgi:excisionase family DNA binding protein
VLREARVARREKRGGGLDRVADPQTFVTGRLLTVSEVADAMRVSNMTVYRLIKGGELPAVRVGKNYRIRQRELETFLNDRSVHVEGA